MLPFSIFLTNMSVCRMKQSLFQQCHFYEQSLAYSLKVTVPIIKQSYYFFYTRSFNLRHFVYFAIFCHFRDSAKTANFRIMNLLRRTLQRMR